MRDSATEQASLDLDASELAATRCAEAWGSLTDEQANSLYGNVLPLIGAAPVPDPITSQIEKYCEVGVDYDFISPGYGNPAPGNANTFTEEDNTFRP